ncbi:mRNA turnover protein 4 homolog [Dysidea avara]|uniref:mRNA turnover protein 4 homolog n=1 Tax=Dysidea avara TaxID=196820 RepID=UPI00331A23E9
MPKSKRNKTFHLTATKKKGRNAKEDLLQKVRDSVDQFSHACVFSVDNMRNNLMKDLRQQLGNGRIFLGKNKVLQLALGRNESEEYKDGLHFVSKKLTGNVGLLFTDQSVSDIVSLFKSATIPEFARAGCVATEDVNLSAGPLEQFIHSMEPQLRQLGLPTTLKKGVIVLLSDHIVCKKGDTLTPEQARLLKLLNFTMAEFKVCLEAVWTKDGTFEEIS